MMMIVVPPMTFLSRIKERAIDSLSCGILITDSILPHNPIIYCNDAFQRLSGYDYDEVVGRNCHFLQDDDRDQPALAELRTAIVEGRECRVTLRSYRKDGSRFLNQLTVTPTRDDSGRVTNFVGFQEDVTERRHVEDALMESDEKFKALAETTAAGIVIYQGTEVTYVNSAAEKASGYSSQELRSMNFWDVFPPEDQKRIRETGLARQRGEDVPSRYERRIVAKDGGLRWIDIAATTYRIRGQSRGSHHVF